VVPLALDDIQGNILQGYGFTFATYLFFAVPDPASGRRFLSETLPEVTRAEHWGRHKPKTTLNVALTFSGLRALAVPPTVLEALPDAFREPISRRAQWLLGDTGESAPDTWDLGLGTGSAHVLLMLNGTVDNAGRLEDAVATVVKRARRHGLVFAADRQDAETLPNRREHFGWSDGFSQPSIEGGTGPSRPGQGVPQDDLVTWRDLKAGEFIHGYPDEDGQITSGPSATLLRNGTFMVYRKLRQDVALFRRVLREEATRYAATVSPGLDGDQFYELMAAKVVGRWRDGMALELRPHRPAGESRNLGGKAEEGHDNDFRYWARDRDGMICPKGAHIRRANPRDAFGGHGAASRRHRIIRRGMPYGPRLRGRQDDGQPRGLIFICFNACIERQFEVIQAQWCNDGDAFGLGDDKDYLLGDGTGTGKFTIEGRPPYFASAQPHAVLTRGCEYLLVPGIRALRALAAP
jgi:Dyp-type peroxidase family